MELVVQILLGISVIAFGVLLWKSSQRWTWVTLVFAPIVFLEAIFVMGLIAQSSKARIAWQEVIVDLEERLDRANAEQERLKYGVPGQEGEENAVVPLELALQKIRTDAGRVWRGLTKQSVANGQVNLAMPQDPAAAPADPADPNAAAPEQIPSNTIVYAFSEVVDPNQNRIPQIYIGEFEVVQSSPQAITIRPTIPPSAFSQRQQQGLNAQSWAIYELMPIDGHEPFVRENSRPLDDAIFGEIDDAFVNQAFGQGDPETLQSYLRDGKRGQPDDPPETKWVKVEFTQNHTEVVDAVNPRGALEGGYFDTLGRAVDSRLQIEDSNEVQFKAGTQLVLKLEAADELINKGVAKRIDEIFVRPLNDYEEHGRHIFERLDILGEKVIVLNRETKTMQLARTLNEDMLVTGQDDKLKLEAELKQYRIEKAAIDAYVQELQTRKQAMQSRLAALYQSNIQLARDLEKAQMLLKERIDQRTLSAGL